MAKLERLRQYYAHKKDLCLDPRIQAGVTFGIFGQESIDAIMNLPACWQPSASSVEGNQLEQLDADSEYVKYSVTSMTLCPLTEDGDDIVTLRSPDFGTTISLSAPIYNDRYNTKAILEIARSSWLEHLQILADPNIAVISDPPIRSYVEGSYLDDQQVGFFCVNMISPGFYPISTDPDLVVDLLPYNQLVGIGLTDTASLNILDFLKRHNAANDEPFEVATIMRPITWAMMN